MVNEKMKSQSGGDNDPAVLVVVERIMELVKNGDKLGLGSGRAATAFIKALGARVMQGQLSVVGVPTSEASATLARELHIPLIELDENVELDLTIDGADEVAPNLDLIKGWGGALVRERIVAASSRRQIILAGSEKLVKSLGERGRIPVEIIPLALGLVSRKLRALELVPTLRKKADQLSTLITDNGNLILDCALRTPLKNGRAARELETNILQIAGVVDTGFFLGTADQVLIGHGDGKVTELRRSDD